MHIPHTGQHTSCNTNNIIGIGFDLKKPYSNITNAVTGANTLALRLPWLLLH
jgi:hypothetical protein